MYANLLSSARESATVRWWSRTVATVGFCNDGAAAIAALRSGFHLASVVMASSKNGAHCCAAAVAMHFSTSATAAAAGTVQRGAERARPVGVASASAWYRAERPPV